MEMRTKPARSFWKYRYNLHDSIKRSHTQLKLSLKLKFNLKCNLTNLYKKKAGGTYN